MRYWILVLILVPSSLFSQNVNWGIVLSSNNQFNPSFSRSVIAEADSQSYWMGHMMTRKISYNQDHLGDLAMIRLDENGTLMDSIQITGKVAVRNLEYRNGRTYGWFYFKDTLEVNGTTYLRPNQTGSAIISFDPDGTVIPWGAYDDTLASVTFTENGTAIGMGQYAFNGSQSLSEWDMSGNLIRQKTLPNMGFVFNIKLAPSGKLLINGSCLGLSTTIDTITINNPHAYTNYFLALSPSWKALGYKIISDVTCHESFAQETPSGDFLYLGLAFQNTPQFGSLNYAGANTSSEDFFLASISSGFTYQWVQEVPSDTGFCRVRPSSTGPLGIDDQGNIYMLGEQSGWKAHWTPNDFTEPNGLSDILLLSYTSTGVFRWAMTMGSKSFDAGTNIIVKGVDDLVVSGVVGDTLFLPNDTIPAGFNSSVVIRISTSSLGLKDHKDVTKLNFYPNPTRGYLMHNALRPTSYELIDLWGRKLQEGTLIPGEPISMEGYPNGLYLIKSEGKIDRILYQP